MFQEKSLAELLSKSYHLNIPNSVATIFGDMGMVCRDNLDYSPHSISGYLWKLSTKSKAY